VGRGVGGPRHVDAVRAGVTVGTARGAKALIAAGRTLDDAGIAVGDLGLRRPSLDDVFLALTGRESAADESMSGGTSDTAPRGAPVALSPNTGPPPRARSLS